MIYKPEAFFKFVIARNLRTVNFFSSASKVLTGELITEIALHTATIMILVILIAN